MRMGGRLAAAIEIFDTIQTRYQPAAKALSEWGKNHRFAGSADRAIIGNLVYDALRLKGQAVALAQADTARGIIFASFLIAWDKDVVALQQILTEDPYAPDVLNMDEQQLLACWPNFVFNGEANANMPLWLWDMFQDQFQENACAHAKAMAYRAPLDIRTNIKLITRDDLQKNLSEHTALTPTVYAPSGLRIHPPKGQGRLPALEKVPAFAHGFYEIQDEGSQMVAQLALAGKRPKKVLDYCAGAGGKSLALDALLDGKSQIFAYDMDVRRLTPLVERARRAQSSITLVESKAQLKKHADFDLVLVDAPCTGTGTWRRKPDAKWRLKPAQLHIRIQQQKTILYEAAQKVSRGGLLAYITCSMLAHENEHQITDFLVQHPDFKTVNLAPIWHDLFHKPAPIGVLQTHQGAYSVHLSPYLTQTDGFFITVMMRA